VIRRGHGPRVAVVGGGVLGVSTAAQLAERGARVTLLSEADLASGASGRSLSWLNSSGRRSPQYHRLRLLGLDRYLLALPLRRNQRLNDLSQPTEHQLLAPAPHGQTTPRKSSNIHLRQL
jgi:glycine/D-amino acid oxidase-like deaminating enzyme